MDGVPYCGKEDLDVGVGPGVGYERGVCVEIKVGGVLETSLELLTAAGAVELPNFSLCLQVDFSALFYLDVYLLHCAGFILLILSQGVVVPMPDRFLFVGSN